MSTPFRSPALEPLLLLPPYQKAVPIACLQRWSETAIPAGAVLALRVRCPEEAYAALPHVVPPLRIQFPNVSLVLLSECSSGVDLLHLNGRATRLRVRATLTPEAPLDATLRRILPHPAMLHEDVVETLQLLGVRIPHAHRAAVERILEQAWQRGGIASPQCADKRSDDAMTTRFRKQHLPPVRMWRRLGRTLHTALRVQDRCNHSLAVLARQLGYSDDKSLSNQFHEMFGVRPGTVRHALGWEWLVSEWVKLHVSAEARQK